MSMTRNDYEKVAEQLAREREAIDTKQTYLSEVTREFMQTTLDRMTERFACLAYVDNRRFDIKRFCLAAGMRPDLVDDARAERLRNSIGFFGVSLP